MSRKRDRVASNQIDYFRFGQLTIEESGAFAFERFSVNELLFENAAAIVGDDAINHQQRRERVVESEFKGHQDRHQRRAGGRRDKRSHADDGVHRRVRMKYREGIENTPTIQHSKCRTDEKRWRKDAAHRSGSERCGGRN